MYKKARPIEMVPPRDTPQIKRSTQIKVKGWKKIFHESGKERKAGIEIFISHIIDFKTKATVRDTT